MGAKRHILLELVFPSAPLPPCVLVGMEHCRHMSTESGEWVEKLLVKRHTSSVSADVALQLWRAVNCKPGPALRDRSPYPVLILQMHEATLAALGRSTLMNPAHAGCGADLQTRRSIIRGPHSLGCV